MGLLTSASSSSGQSALSKILCRYASLLSSVVYVAGLVWIFVVIWPAFNDKTYFSENALLPGLVDEEFSGSSKWNIDQNVKNLRHLFSKEDASPAGWLLKHLVDYGIEAYEHNFTLHNPLLPSELLTGKNVYAIVRGARAAGTEGIVVVVPFHENNLFAVTTAIALARFAKDKVYWAKDLIFLFADHELIGVQAWLSAYYDVPQSYLDSANLYARSGALQAAVGLEWSESPATHIDIKYNMVNGQLPNLDLVNLANRLVDKFGFAPTLHKVEAPRFAYDQEGYLLLLATAFKGILWQASCKPSGVHGLFGQYGVEAVTLEPYVVKEYAGQSLRGGPVDIARIIEGMLRSVNNLLEHFHQSFFFYVLPAVDRYIPISRYMPSIGLFALAPLLLALSLWLRMLQEDEDVEERGPALSSAEQDQKLRFVSVVWAFLLAHVAGCVVWSLPRMIEVLGSPTVDPGENLFAGTLGMAIALPLFPLVAKKVRFLERDLNQLRCVALLEFGFCLGVVGVLNFGLSLFVAILWVPILCMSKSRRSLCAYLINAVFLFVVNPFSVLLLTQLADYCIQAYVSGVPMQLEVLPWALLDSVKSTLSQTVVENAIFNSWMFPLVSLWFIPIWTNFWILVHC